MHEASRVFASDACAGEEAKQGEAREVPGECRGSGGDKINAKSNEEEALAAQPVGQPVEQEGAEHGAGQIEAAGQSHFGIREGEGWALSERSGNRAGESDLQSV